MTDASRRPAAVDTTSLAARVTQALMALVLTVISVLLMITTHRLQVTLFGVGLPAGLVLGALFQTVTTVFLYAATGSRLPLVVLGSLWPLAAIPFLGHGAGGGVLMPAEVGGQVQYSGWIVQGLAIAIPFLAALAITLRRHRPRARRRTP